MSLKNVGKKRGPLNAVESYIALRNYIESRPTPASRDDIEALREARQSAADYAEAYDVRLPAESPLEVRARKATARHSK